MRNFISEDDIEQTILQKLGAEPFKYDILRCDASPDQYKSLLLRLMSGKWRFKYDN